MEHLKKLIRGIPDFPKPGILFRDITPLLASHEGFQDCIDILYNHYHKKQIDVVVGIESRGFIFGTPLALRLQTAFVPIRKQGKLPGDTISHEYTLEYGSNVMEIHKDSIKRGQRVLIIDDLLATGGTLYSACELVEELGGEVVSCSCIVELAGLPGREVLKGRDLFTMLQFEES